MKISSKVEYGIVALIDISLNCSGKNVVKVTEISRRNNISAKYLEQIIPLLKQAGFINSVKGAGGGYSLSRDASEITLNEIVNALDNTVFTSSGFSKKNDSTAVTAINECLWKPVNDYLQRFSKSITLRELTDKYNEVQNRECESMYYI